MIDSDPRNLQVLDFLTAALIKHDQELSELGEKLQESIERLTKGRFLENFKSSVRQSSDDGALLNRIDEVHTELQTLKRNISWLGSNSLELEVTRKLSRTHIRTYRTLSEEIGMTASEIADLTSRSRASELVYLNQLVALGFVKKVKAGRKQYYTKVPIQHTESPSPTSIHGKVMILVMVSEEMAEDQNDVEDLVSRRLSDLKNWRIERSTILSR
ncbi:MAG: hypothetical protein V1850_05035 [Candidatus Bathyarchaeota archaeon]